MKQAYLVLAWNKFIITAIIVVFAVLFKNEWYLWTSGEDKSKTNIPKDFRNNRRHLVYIGWEVHSGWVAIFQTVISEKGIEAEMTW